MELLTLINELLIVYYSGVLTLPLVLYLLDNEKVHDSYKLNISEKLILSIMWPVFFCYLLIPLKNKSWRTQK